MSPQLLSFSSESRKNDKLKFNKIKASGNFKAGDKLFLQ